MTIPIRAKHTLAQVTEIHGTTSKVLKFVA